MEFSIIAAMTKNRGIGFQNKLPWSKEEGKEDMKHFRKITTENKDTYIVMGRKTWESLKKPLDKRTNVVISKTINDHKGRILVLDNLETLFKMIHFSGDIKSQIFIIGGQQLYQEAIVHPFCKKIYLTELDLETECDRFFPKIPPYFKLTEETPFEKGVFMAYSNNINHNSEEFQYLNLLENILTIGEEKTDRTGTGTISLFGSQMRFSLKNDIIPLLTTKKVYWKGVIEELLFFLRGDHDNRKLQKKGVHIWDGNTSREFLDKNNSKLESDDLGKAYGVQWRAAGAPIVSLEESYLGKGFDQLQNVIHLLKHEPDSRRIIINAWNVPELKDMALPPCHMLYQFYVSQGKYLNCMMTQRSADTFLGLPFNIASTAVLTRILANVSNLLPGEIIISIGDAHIYKNHIEQVKKQLCRDPLNFPKLNIVKKLNNLNDIENLKYEDFELDEYCCWAGIKAKMAI